MLEGETFSSSPLLACFYERRGYAYLKDVHAPWGLIHILYRRLT